MEDTILEVADPTYVDDLETAVQCRVRTTLRPNWHLMIATNDSKKPLASSLWTELLSGTHGPIASAVFDTHRINRMKSIKIKDISRKYSHIVREMIDETPDEEMGTFPVQEREADAWYEAFVNGNPLPDTPLVDGLLAERTAKGRVETKEEFVGKIRTKATAYKQYLKVTGKRQRIEKDIEEATTPSEIRAINWEDN